MNPPMRASDAIIAFVLTLIIGYFVITLFAK